MQGGELQNLCALLADEKHPRIFMAADSKGNQLQGIPRANNILLHAYMNRLAMSPSLKALLPSLLEHLPSFINYGVGLYNRAQVRPMGARRYDCVCPQRRMVVFGGGDCQRERGVEGTHSLSRVIRNGATCLRSPYSPSLPRYC